ncbi:uncharacterized protein LOC106642620 [Copidosoma floridanum]|uniref:uncharacterized protein LOC106642620 n=1 Tax=Copidosoma floridanum TaxID=29053 RepID=UPI000C6F9AEC|nr:uncharacterized protein LOC106642620 [Copidosoma floridanum]
MSSTTRNAPTSSVLPIFMFNWIFGIGVIEYPLGKPRPVISFVYTSMLLATYCVLAGLTYSESNGFSLYDASRIILPIRIFFFAHILLTIVTLTLGWFRSQSLHKCLMKAALIDDMMNQIGIKNVRGQIFKRQIGSIVANSAFTFLIMGFNAAFIELNDVPLYHRLLMTITISYPVFVMFIADLTFMNIVKNVSCARYRLQMVNEVLKNMITTTMEFPQHKRLLSLPTKESKNLDVYMVDGMPKNHAIVLKISKRIHLLVVKICRDADSMYGVQMLLSIVAAFAVITGDLYIMYATLVDKYASRIEILETCSVVSIWSIRTGDVINELYDDPTINSDIQSEIRDFNIQLIQNPLKFSALGFIDLDFSLIQGMTASITTYLMILIQLGKLTPSTVSFYNNTRKSRVNEKF